MSTLFSDSAWDGLLGISPGRFRTEFTPPNAVEERSRAEPAPAPQHGAACSVTEAVRKIDNRWSDCCPHFTFNEYCYLHEELERSLARRRQAEHCSQLALSQHRAHDERQRSIDLTSTTRGDASARVACAKPENIDHAGASRSRAASVVHSLINEISEPVRDSG